MIKKSKIKIIIVFIIIAVIIINLIAINDSLFPIIKKRKILNTLQTKHAELQILVNDEVKSFETIDIKILYDNVFVPMDIFMERNI